VNVGGIGRTMRAEVRILSPRPAFFPPARGTMAAEAKRIIVHGRVQGVGFRFFVRDLGERLGLAGNVWNRYDRAVEIVVEGGPEQIAEFIQEVEMGPPMARVLRLEVEDLPATGAASRFQIEGW